MPDADVEAFLGTLAGDPRLLEPLADSDTDTGEAIARRTQDEVHGCVKCGQPARCALVAKTRLGPRWVDLCAPCYQWLNDGILNAI